MKATIEISEEEIRQLEKRVHYLGALRRIGMEPMDIITDRIAVRVYDTLAQQAGGAGEGTEVEG